MAGYLFDQKSTLSELKSFFAAEKPSLNNFGSTVNQTFEAKVLTSVITWYKKNGWRIRIVNPVYGGKKRFRLKFSTRGAPVNYTYIRCFKKGKRRQIRHGLRTHTKSYNASNSYSANIVCDIVVIEDINLDMYDTSRAIDNKYLISFGEVKHMSAFAELIANFIGMVHELKPDSLKGIRKKSWVRGDDISSFLYVSGILYNTAEGLHETIIKRKFDVDIYSFNNPL